MRLGDNDVTATFGFSEGGKVPVEMIEEVSVNMTPRTLKILANNLTKAVDLFEKQHAPIKVPAGKLVDSAEDLAKRAEGQAKPKPKAKH